MSVHPSDRKTSPRPNRIAIHLSDGEHAALDNFRWEHRFESVNDMLRFLVIVGMEAAATWPKEKLTAAREASARTNKRKEA
jgi:hypothetical protein